MTNNESETRSYRDPLGSHAAQIGAATRAYRSKFPAVTSAYDGYYAVVETNSREGMSYLAGGEGIIGTKVDYCWLDGCLQLVTHAGQTIASLKADDAKRICEHLDKGWQVSLFLSLVIVDQVNHTHLAELACLCYSPEACAGDFTQAMETFTGNIAYRIAKGEHPGLALSEDQFVRVLESGGTWYLTKKVELPELQKGQIYYRRRRSAGEGLIEMAYQGKLGCKIAAIVFWVVFFVAIIALAIWLFL
jgi:hypothetical protein